MYDKSVRRRRIALALLVACSLLLLTAYFGESQGGGLHSVQRGVLQVVSPIQEGASRALKPVRDLFGWFGDTINAKGEVSGLKKQNAVLRRAAIAGTDAVRMNAELQKLVGLDQTAGLQGTKPVAARVIGGSPTIWNSTINIDVGVGRRRARRPAGDHRRRPRRRGHLRRLGLRGRHADHRRLERRARPASAGRGRPGIVQTGAGGPRDLRFNWPSGTGRIDEGHGGRDRRHDLQLGQVRVALPAGHPGRRRHARRRRRHGDPAGPPRRPTPTCSASSSSRS